MIKPRILSAILAFYFTALHVIIAVFFLKPHLINQLKSKLDYKQPEISELYKTLLTFQLRSDALLPNDSVIFIGDSITQGLCVSCVAKGSANYGIGGDTTLGVLKRIAKYHSIKNSKAVVLAIGLNDLDKRDDEEILGNFKEIIHMIPLRIPMIVSGVLPVDESFTLSPARKNNRIRELNNKIMLLCRKYKNSIFFNSTSNLVDRAGNLKRQFHTGDGVHLSTDGYKVWITDLRQKLHEIR